MSCSKCTLINSCKAVTCDGCGFLFAHEVFTSQTATAGIQQKNCPSCTLLVSEWEVQCGLCGAEISSAQSKTSSIAGQKQESGGRAVFSFMREPESSSSQLTGLFPLIKNCYHEQVRTGRSSFKGLSWRLCSPLTHISQRKSLGADWSCGYRNIQMLCSSLLQLEEYQRVLFDGTTRNGCPPNIKALQGWLERAWKMGFDTAGAEHFNGQIVGESSWIGATECVALLRSFGVRADVVDFELSKQKGNSKNKPNSKGKTQNTMRGYLNCKDTSNNPSSVSVGDSNKENEENHQMLMDWVWKYLEPSVQSREACSGTDFCSWPPGFLPPLYFQHQGHSRTIIGMETGLKLATNAIASNLLVFDPIQLGENIQDRLSERKGWERFIKRGLHTLKKNAYQIVLIRPGLMSSESQQKSMVIKPIDPRLIFHSASEHII